MNENCKNCSEVIVGNFCSNCGQKKFKRIDKSTFGMNYNTLYFTQAMDYSIR